MPTAILPVKAAGAGRLEDLWWETGKIFCLISSHGHNAAWLALYSLGCACVEPGESLCSGMANAGVCFQKWHSEPSKAGLCLFLVV